MRKIIMAAAAAGAALALSSRRNGLIARRWRVTRDLERDPYGKTLPDWARHLIFGLYLEQGWKACDQRQNGKTVAAGDWGDELFLLTDGSIACTRYPDGYDRAVSEFLESSRATLSEGGEHGQ